MIAKLCCIFEAFSHNLFFELNIFHDKNLLFNSPLHFAFWLTFFSLYVLSAIVQKVNTIDVLLSVSKSCSLTVEVKVVLIRTLVRKSTATVVVTTRAKVHIKDR